MTQIRDVIMGKLHRKHNPWAGLQTDNPTGIQGWNSSHPWLAEAIVDVRPSIVVEIGVWKGASVVQMANKMRELDLNGVVIAVDTWLGSSELWWDEKWSQDLPTLYHRFLDNIYTAGLADYVVPLRLDSLNAARLMRLHGIKPNVIHLDAGHDLHSVHADLTAWWPILAPHGTYIGDDYYADTHFPELKLATDSFFEKKGVLLEYERGKCRVRKT